MRMVAVRPGPVFGSTTNWTAPVPLPFPEPPFVTATHGVFAGAAVQLQPAGAVTATVPVPAPADTVCDPGVSEYEQPLPWLMVTVRPATVTVPERAPPVFAATV